MGSSPFSVVVIQSNFNGSNSFGTRRLVRGRGSSRVENSARSGDIIRIFLIFYNMKVYLCSH